jgi:hypothetical protein
VRSIETTGSTFGEWPGAERGFFFSRMKVCAWALWLQAFLRFISTETLP